MDNYHFGYIFQQERIKRNVSPYFNIENSTNTHIVKADQHNSYQLSRQHGLNLRFNPLTPGDFWEKRNLDVFVHFLAWIEATLAPIYPKAFATSQHSFQNKNFKTFSVIQQGILLVRLVYSFVVRLVHSFSANSFLISNR